MLQAFDWKFLPARGSLLDQPGWLMDDLAIISWQHSVVKDLRDAALEEAIDGSSLNQKA